MLRQLAKQVARSSGLAIKAGPSSLPAQPVTRINPNLANAIPRRCYASLPNPPPFPRDSGSRHATRQNQPPPKVRPPPASVTSKATKRRRATASQSIRADLTLSPTRGPVLQCIAHSTAAQYDLEALEESLRLQGIKWDTVMPGGGEDQAIVITGWREIAPGAAREREGAVFASYGREDPEVESNAAEQPNADSTFAPFVQPSSAQSTYLSTPSTSTLSPSPLSFSSNHGLSGEIWIFRNGSYVTWGLNALEGKAFLWEVVRGGKGLVERGRVEGEVETEEVEFVVDEDAETTIKGNLILLGRPPLLSTLPPGPTYASLLTRYTLSLSLARSAALSSLEAKLDAHLESVARLPETLATWGKQPLKRKEVIRKIGELMMLREAVNFRGGGLEDTPEIYWSEPQLEEYFDTISTEFEMKERIDAINQKIDYASDVQSTLRALLTEASGHRMELIIIALIAVEVVIVLIREGPELFHKFVDILPTIRTPSSLVGDELPALEQGEDSLALNDGFEATPVLAGLQRRGQSGPPVDTEASGRPQRHLI